MFFFGYIQGVYGQLSEYELKRLETIRENQAFLSSINLLGVGMLLTLIYPEMADIAQLNIYWFKMDWNELFFLFFLKAREELKQSKRPSLRGLAR